MVEIELKFQIPATSARAVQRAVTTSSAQTTHLRAQYFDTPDRRLAAAGMALRLRQEDERWVQTLKGRGDGHLHRLEHEVVIDVPTGEPLLDITRHAGTPAGAALTRVLGGDVAVLRVMFETDVQRTHRIIRSGSAHIELALDIGEIRSGAARLPLHEIEFELKQGPLAGLIALSSRWVERHALWLDVRSKAERGDLLARSVNVNAATLAEQPALRTDMSADAALRAMVGACLAQILPNVAALAGGVGETEHLHQARVGLRRLRSALRVFGEGSDDVDATWQPALAELFAHLGSARDQDVLADTLLPALRAAGAPDLIEDSSAADKTGADDTVGEVLRAPACGLLLLDLMAFAHGVAEADDRPSAPPLVERVRPLVEHLQRQLKKDAAEFLACDDSRRHRTRKRLKRLRYAVELLSSVCRGKAVKRYLARLRPAQDALGLYNDLTVAEALFRGRLEHDPRAWFALGWLAAQRQKLLADAAQALAELPRSARIWRHD
jgi:inorganic triphosphatase YgiF